MEGLRLVIAVVLPLSLGALCVGAATPGNAPGRRALVAGYGLLLGLFLVTFALRLLDALGVALSFAATATLLAALCLPAALVQYRVARSGPVVDGPDPPLHLSRGAWGLCAGLLLLIALRLLGLGLELAWRPLFPWDATMHWATKARVWFDARSLVPFVDNQRWLALAGQDVFTDHHPGYPATVPLLQLWFALALDAWDESLINLPWLLCLVGLSCAFYGQARATGSRLPAAVVFSYLLVSLPLLDTHVALAGYADLFLGASYCAAIMAFHHWCYTGARGQALLAVVFALCCPLIKNEGLFWLLTFLPALAARYLPVRRLWWVLGGGTLVLALLLLLLPADLSVAGHTLGNLRLQFHPEAVRGVAESIWVFENWHLLGYLLPALLVAALAGGVLRPGRLPAIAIALAGAVALFLVLFLFTRYSFGAIRFTAVGRISLQLAPSLLFLTLQLWNGVSRREPGDGQSSGPAGDSPESAADRPPSAP